MRSVHSYNVWTPSLVAPASWRLASINLQPGLRHFGNGCTVKIAPPAALECFNALRQLGILAQLSLIPSKPYHFANDEDALEDIRWRLHLSRTLKHTALLRTAMDELLERDAIGQLKAMHQPVTSAVICWQH